MKWSWKVGQLAGIDLRIHATFVLLPGWFGASYRTASKSIVAMPGGVGFTMYHIGEYLVIEATLRKRIARAGFMNRTWSTPGLVSRASRRNG